MQRLELSAVIRRDSQKMRVNDVDAIEFVETAHVLNADSRTLLDRLAK